MYAELQSDQGRDLAMQVHAKLEEALTMIQDIRVRHGSDAHTYLLTASNSVWNAQFCMERAIQEGCRCRPDDVPHE
jgi:hypothetical protein